MRQPELEHDGNLVAGLRERALEEWNGLLGTAARHVDDARVVERLAVRRLGLQRPAEVVEGLLVSLLVEVQQGLLDLHIARGGLHCRRADEERENEPDDDAGGGTTCAF